MKEIAGKSSAGTQSQAIELMNGVMARPHGSWIIIRKCENDHFRNDDGDIILYRTETDHDMTNWCEILSVGPKCVNFSAEDVGKFILAPELDAGMVRLGSFTEQYKHSGQLIQMEDFAIREEAQMDHYPAVVDSIPEK